MSLIMVGDFETTVFKGQTETLVWASALVPLNSENVVIHSSIDETYHYLVKLASKQNVVVYYHNLKFDGSFWLDYIAKHTGLRLSYTSDDLLHGRFVKYKEQESNTYSYSISHMGQWYNIVIKLGKYTIELRDSLKLLPFSVRALGKSFGTKHRKLDMEYAGFRFPGWAITDEERRYIENDVLVVKEALEIMYAEGHRDMTIGSCCLREFKRIMGDDYRLFFPNLYDGEEHVLNKGEYGSSTFGEYIRHSYRGGWCYLVKGKANKMFHGGTTADVNSLYPSMMHSESGNRFPVGEPTFWTGDFPEEALRPDRYYFVRILTRFYLKPGKLPFIQIKNRLEYPSTESLETSDIYNPKTGEYDVLRIGMDGKLHINAVELTLTRSDFELIQEHYDLVDLRILDGCWFDTMPGLFDPYINKYRKLKIEATDPCHRMLAKLMLNNLYGKLSASKDSSYKVGYLEEGVLKFITIRDDGKTPGYIPIGSAITSYARCFTIRAAQANYHGPDKPGFIYADTDSIHCDLPPEELVGIKVHPKNFCCWALETCWDEGFFVRQKTYIEHVTHKDLEPIEKPFYDVKCAGMPSKCKDLFLKSVAGWDGNPKYVSDGVEREYTEEEKKFLSVKREITDFAIGLTVPGKLMPKRIPGGVLLVETEYKMHEKVF